MNNFDDKISIELTDVEFKALNDAVNSIGNVLKDKLVTLESEDRQYYGRLGPKSEFFALEAASLMSEQPNTIPSLLDKEEYERDFKAFKQLNGLINLLNPLIVSLEDSIKLLGYDLLQDAFTYQNYIDFLAENNIEGSRALAERLKAKNPYKQKRSKKNQNPK